jgi:hypothetical protein
VDQSIGGKDIKLNTSKAPIFKWYSQTRYFNGMLQLVWLILVLRLMMLEIRLDYN